MPKGDEHKHAAPQRRDGQILTDLHWGGSAIVILVQLICGNITYVMQNNLHVNVVHVLKL